MKNKFKKLIIVNLLCIFLFFSIVNTVQADPSVGEIKLNPPRPAPQSDVTISTDITGGDISKVRLIINECDKETGVCHVPRNISMSKNGELSKNIHLSKGKLPPGDGRDRGFETIHSICNIASDFIITMEIVNDRAGRYNKNIQCGRY